MRRAELLIADSRRETENEEFTDSTGIQDEEYIRYINSAQEDLQSAIARQHQRVFQAETDIDVVSGQDEYSLPQDIYLENRISNVWYTDTGNTKDLRTLHAMSQNERVFDRANTPAGYIRKSGKLVLTPIPNRTTTNGIKIAYVKRLPKIDKRRATISAVTTSGSTITSLTLDTAQELDATALLEEPKISVVNVDGDQVMRRIPITGINITTGAVTLGAGFTFEAGETISVGDYVVRGEDTVNRSELPLMCERYLVEFMNWRTLRRDSSSDAQGQTEELVALRGEIVSTFAQVDDDVKMPAITNTQFIDDEDLFIFF